MGVSAEVACPRGCLAGVGSPEGLVKKERSCFLASLQGAEGELGGSHPFPTPWGAAPVGIKSPSASASSGSPLKTTEKGQLADLSVPGFQKSGQWKGWDLHNVQKLLRIYLLFLSRWCYTMWPLSSGFQNCWTHFVPACLQIYHCNRASRYLRRAVFFFLSYELKFSYNQIIQAAWALRKKHQIMWATIIS